MSISKHICYLFIERQKYHCQLFAFETAAFSAKITIAKIIIIFQTIKMLTISLFILFFSSIVITIILNFFVSFWVSYKVERKHSFVAFTIPRGIPFIFNVRSFFTDKKKNWWKEWNAFKYDMHLYKKRSSSMMENCIFHHNCIMKKEIYKIILCNGYKST